VNFVGLVGKFLKPQLGAGVQCILFGARFRYEEWEGQLLPDGRAQGRFAWLRTTGKWAGMKLSGSWKSQMVSPGQWYSDSEWEMEK